MNAWSREVEAWQRQTWPPLPRVAASRPGRARGPEHLSARGPWVVGKHRVPSEENPVHAGTQQHELFIACSLPRFVKLGAKSQRTN